MNAVLICLGASYIAAAIPGALIALYLIQRFYLRTSRQMRLLDLESKSPLYQHFTETIEGLETIRAFGWQNFYNNGATTKIDVSQKPYYLLLSIQRWLNLVLDCVVGILAVLLVAIALSIPQSSSGGALGVALTSVLMFNTSLKQMITNWTQAETSLGSISRTASFERDTPSENSTNGILDPSSDWPSKGDVKVAGMSVIYRYVDEYIIFEHAYLYLRSDGTKALRDVSFHVSSGQKIGICGRTGR
jgi:ABC-type multidrug transport system fused ATPase/permease subunit